MVNITICSEPLVESFGKGFTDEERAGKSYSGDALNMAASITRVNQRLQEYRDDHTPPPDVSIFCGLGDDANGHEIKNFMTANGINTHYVVTQHGPATAGYIINREEGGAKRSVKYENRGIDSPMCQLLEPGPHSISTGSKMRHIAKYTDVLVITGIGASRARSDQAFNKLVRLAQDVKLGGGTVIVDLNHRFNPENGDAKLWVDDTGKTSLPNDQIRKRMDQLFAVADISFVAHDEIWPMYGDLYQPPLKGDTANPDPIVAHLQQLKSPPGCDHPRHIVFKRGSEGGTLFYQNGTCVTQIHSPGFPVTPKDRNGGGDNLIGGTIAGLLNGYSLDQAFVIGQLMAGKVIQHAGGVIQPKYLPNNEELDILIPKDRKITDFALSKRMPQRGEGMSQKFGS